MSCATWGAWFEKLTIGPLQGCFELSETSVISMELFLIFQLWPHFYFYVDTAKTAVWSQGADFHAVHCTIGAVLLPCNVLQWWFGIGYSPPSFPLQSPLVEQKIIWRGLNIVSDQYFEEKLTKISLTFNPCHLRKLINYSLVLINCDILTLAWFSN